MTTGSVKTTNGKKLYLYRANTSNVALSSTQYLQETQFCVGVDNVTPSVSNTDLTKRVPITNGTVNDDASNALTGSSGGTNTTDNTTTYKEGANQSDNTAQNLLANSTSATKIWTISDLTSNGNNCVSTKYVGAWLYIKDATALAKFASSGTAVELRIGVDSTTNYYSKTYAASVLSTGWNWLCDNALLSTWTSNGTPGTLNDFQIRITTNNATDTFVAGDVIYDLLRQWSESDFYKDIESGYPTFDYTNLEVTRRCYLTTIHANGFNLDGVASTNEDTIKIMASETTHTDISKSETDEIVYIIVDRVL